MGRPSARKRSAQRPGKRERARIKKLRRTRVTNVSSAGTYTFTAGRKKSRGLRSFLRKSPWRPISRGTVSRTVSAEHPVAGSGCEAHQSPDNNVPVIDRA